MSGGGDQAAHAVWLLLALMLVASGMIGRRVPLARLVGWSAAWAMLFLGLYIVFQWLEPEITAWQQSRRAGELSVVAPSSSADPADPGALSAAAGEVHVPISSDGHYWVEATIRDQQVRFLIDSGASITALSEATASRLGLAADPMAAPIVVQTANGPVTARRALVDDLRIGAIRASDLPVIVSPSFGDVNVLGPVGPKLRFWSSWRTRRERAGCC